MNRIFTTVIRNLKKHSGLSVINITGLVLGMLSTMFILEYVVYERSFESHHENAENVYRVAYNRYKEGNLLWETANSFYPTGLYLKEKFDEVEDFFTIQRNYNINLSCVNQQGQKVGFNEEKAYYSTASIFDLLTIPIVEGFKDIDQPNTVAISEFAAKKYFGNENPIGKIITMNLRNDFKVIAVYKDFPANTHLKTDFLFSLTNVINQRPTLKTEWLYDYFHNYIRLKPGIDYKTFADKAFNAMMEDNYRATLARRNMHDYIYLQPIRDIHLKSNIEYETEPPGNDKAITILFIFSLFFLAIAWINYINLSSARAIERAKEVGVKKVAGVSKALLSAQFFMETLYLNLFCFVITLVLFLILNPLFQNITHIGDFNILLNSSFWIITPVVFIVGSVLSGIYPTFIITQFTPITVLKGNFAKSSQGLAFRKLLVTIQFVVSLSLLIGTFIIFSQVNFLTNKNTGVNCTSKLVVKAPLSNLERTEHFNRFKALKNSLLTYPEIADITFSSDVPGIEIERWFYCYKKGSEPSTGLAHFRIDADNNFTDFYNIKLLAGRGFIESDLPDERKIIVNRKAMERIGYTNPEDAVGKIVLSGANRESEIVGVVDNFQFKSVKIEAGPVVILNQDGAKQYLSVLLSKKGASNMQYLLENMKQKFELYFPGQPFEYFMQEDLTAKNLKPDETFVVVFGLFSGLAIVISVIGVLGLIIITINQKMKELGVRKVLGANRLNIFKILSNSMSSLFLVALIIGIPLTYYVFDSWVLSNYIHRIQLNWIYFLIPSLMLASVFAIIILFQAIKAANNNVTVVLNADK
jgi:putative ABC transport system permease protein